MRKLLMPTLAALVLATAMAGIAIGAGGGGAVDHKHFRYAIGLWGDLPYSGDARPGARAGGYIRVARW
jgi:hypothetical protein